MEGQEGQQRGCGGEEGEGQGYEGLGWTVLRDNPLIVPRVATSASSSSPPNTSSSALILLSSQPQTSYGHVGVPS
jgi:hypothetical protein